MGIRSEDIKAILSQYTIKPDTVLPMGLVVVSADGNGQFTTITNALNHAESGTCIVVQPGIYHERILIDKDVEIVGYGRREEIIIESHDVACVTMHTAHASLCGFSLRYIIDNTKSSDHYGVVIPQGRLFLEDCDITSNSLACIAIYGHDTNPTIRRCNIHDGEKCGVIVYEEGKGTCTAPQQLRSTFRPLLQQILRGEDAVAIWAAIPKGQNSKESSAVSPEITHIHPSIKIIRSILKIMIFSHQKWLSLLSV